MIYGIIGYAGSGKDTVADILVTHFGYQKLSFASALKDVVAELFDWDRELVEGDTEYSRHWREQPDIWWETQLNWGNHPLSEKCARFTPRAALQLISTDVFRKHFFDGFWITRLKKKLVGKDKVVITDCRFENEINLVREAGGEIIRVINKTPEWEPIALDAVSGSPTSEDSKAKLAHVHVSEWGWLSTVPDMVIRNQGTIADLETFIKSQFSNKN